MNDKKKHEVKELTLSRLYSGGVIANYYCSSRCGHCLYFCSPRREKDYLDEKTAGLIFKRIMELGCPSVHIGGGEPFLDIPGLSGVLNAAQATGMSVDYVETNSSWFINDQQAQAILKKLRPLGLHTLLVSISPFHNEFIPFYKVKGIIAAAQAAGVSVFPWVSGFWDDLDSFPDHIPHSPDEYTARFGPDYLRSLPNRYWIHPGGRVFKTFEKIFKHRPVEKYIETINGCMELEDATHFHMDVHGRYTPALCSGVAIAGADLGAPLRQDKYPLVTLLYNEGPASLYRYAREEWGFVPRDGYISKCHLCQHIRGFLVLEKGVGLNEFGPALFYGEEAAPEGE